MFETLIINGRVLDGAGNPWRRLDVGIADGRIAALLPAASRDESVLQQAAQVLDVQDAVIAPGFIDMHSHSDLQVFVDPHVPPKLSQGITTELLGQDGLSAAPVNSEAIAERRSGLAGLDGDPPIAWTWSSFDDYLHALERARPTPNLAALVPHGGVRECVMGLDAVAPSAVQLDRMCALLDESLAAGAVGMSTGLAYTPCRYADFDELAALYRVVARRGGILVAHVRNEAGQVLTAVDEMIRIGRLTGVPVHISHLKIVGRENWPLAERLLALFDAARRDGIDITFDMYPYTAGSTVLSVCLPAWAHAGGAEALIGRIRTPADRERMRREIEEGIEGWENLARACGWEGISIASVGSERNRDVLGRSLLDIAQQQGNHPFDAMCDLLVDEHLNVTMIDYYGSEDVLQAFLRHPLATIGSDGIFGVRPHPRLYGTFPRILGRYVRELSVLTLEEAVRKMTAAPAGRLGLAGRGLIAVGAQADLVVFDPATVGDTATFAEPISSSAGLHFVFVNGALAYADGRPTSERTGQVVRRAY